MGTNYLKLYTAKEVDFTVSLCKLMNLEFEVREVKDVISYTEIKITIKDSDTKVCFNKMLEWNYYHNIVV